MRRVAHATRYITLASLVALSWGCLSEPTSPAPTDTGPDIAVDATTDAY
jgi:hypothetical protein